MFYVVDSVGRIIVRGRDRRMMEDFAHRIAVAGASCHLVTDDKEHAGVDPASWTPVDHPLGKSEAWRLENDPRDARETSVGDVEKIVGQMEWQHDS